ncbi:tumor necrosis factor receptor superfamily member 8 [Echinops telfairi]|uniref:Tumor necrosis factor receptor superfamily member 8 n=1 Tax=Echinops telfairi TaxID=9371 RepID=A0AC55DTR7_ECHTE|nr:tumor necrosis factor receptor superfamily member 8 [Echinops telfairi]
MLLEYFAVDRIILMKNWGAEKIQRGEVTQPSVADSGARRGRRFRGDRSAAQRASELPGAHVGARGPQAPGEGTRLSPALPRRTMRALCVALGLLLLLGALRAVPQDRASKDTCDGDPSHYYNETLGKCCYRCPSGQSGQQLCPQRSTDCRKQCKTDYYLSKAGRCLACVRCLRDDLVETRPCTNNSPRFCECRPGMFCISPAINSCARCLTHSVCPKGTVVKLRDPGLPGRIRLRSRPGNDFRCPLPPSSGLELVSARSARRLRELTACGAPAARGAARPEEVSAGWRLQGAPCSLRTTRKPRGLPLKDWALGSQSPASSASIPPGLLNQLAVRTQGVYHSSAPGQPLSASTAEKDTVCVSAPQGIHSGCTSSEDCKTPTRSEAPEATPTSSVNPEDTLPSKRVPHHPSSGQPSPESDTALRATTYELPPSLGTPSDCSTSPQDSETPDSGITAILSTTHGWEDTFFSTSTSVRSSTGKSVPDAGTVLLVTLVLVLLLVSCTFLLFHWRACRKGLRQKLYLCFPGQTFQRTREPADSRPRKNPTPSRSTTVSKASSEGQNVVSLLRVDNRPSEETTRLERERLLGASPAEEKIYIMKADTVIVGTVKTEALEGRGLAMPAEPEAETELEADRAPHYPEQETEPPLGSCGDVMFSVEEEGKEEPLSSEK